jgi:hypothetical protein
VTTSRLAAGDSESVVAEGRRVARGGEIRTSTFFTHEDPQAAGPTTDADEVARAAQACSTGSTSIVRCACSACVALEPLP